MHHTASPVTRAPLHCACSHILQLRGTCQLPMQRIRRALIEGRDSGSPVPGASVPGPSVLCAVLEDCSSGSLTSMVRLQQQLSATGTAAYSPRTALQWLLGVARALDSLHCAQPLVIHR